jgi:hypothetical protein
LAFERCDGRADDRLDERTASDAAAADRPTKVGRGDGRGERDVRLPTSESRDGASYTTGASKRCRVGNGDVVDLRAGLVWQSTDNPDWAPGVVGN